MGIIYMHNKTTNAITVACPGCGKVFDAFQQHFINGMCPDCYAVANIENNEPPKPISQNIKELEDELKRTKDALMRLRAESVTTGALRNDVDDIRKKFEDFVKETRQEMLRHRCLIADSNLFSKNIKSECDCKLDMLDNDVHSPQFFTQSLRRWWNDRNKKRPC